ncbi:hypothetical protein PF003_g8921 [Phytophthora fragariae]|nr:hypothetical protein PF003_g29661 [Phytophthora fragariae]KAE8906896.1 hypothetical protein PF003_g8921 [Phytophthora fragariae]
MEQELHVERKPVALDPEIVLTPEPSVAEERSAGVAVSFGPTIASDVFPGVYWAPIQSDQLAQDRVD